MQRPRVYGNQYPEQPAQCNVIQDEGTDGGNQAEGEAEARDGAEFPPGPD